MAWRNEGSHLGRSIRIAAAAILTASALVLAAGPADAHGRHHRHFAHISHARHGAAARVAASGVPSSPRFSAIVVDANSGRTIYAVDPDGLRHPASITKVMTLYLLFEQLDKGAMTLQSRIPISEHAAAQDPSKLGIRPGQTISIDDAIKAVVTRSANDIAVAIAEAIGGDESTFAQMMTRKAHALGMANTQYRNASGLPNDYQITTARDLTTLARSLEDRFPRYFKYFSIEEFEYAGQTIGNHNHMLGRVDGVDGIKTGYTRASGFNLLTSVHRDGRSLLAVVMGGTSAPARDRVMENLIDDHLAQCSTVRTATRIAEASTDTDSKAEPAPAVHPRPIAVAANVPTRPPAARAAQTDDGEGDNADDDQGPTLRVSAVQAVAGSDPPRSAPVRNQLIAEHAADAKPVANRAPPAKRTMQVEAGGTKGIVAAGVTPPAKPKFDPPGKTPSETTVAARATEDNADDEAPQGSKGWKVQIGATDDAAKAAAMLDKARLRDKSLLATAIPMTERVRKGDGAFYRAQFAGLDSAAAESTCRSLKRSGFSCFATRD